MNLEPLRELERKWLRTADEYTAQGDNADDDDERAWAHGRSEAYASAADDLSRALAQLDDGWVLVPRCATETMRNVAITRYQEFADDHEPYTREGERQQMQAVWAAMIGAIPDRPLPSPPAQPQGPQA